MKVIVVDFLLPCPIPMLSYLQDKLLSENIDSANARVALHLTGIVVDCTNTCESLLVTTCVYPSLH